MAKKKKAPSRTDHVRSLFEELDLLIENLVEAAIAESWKNGNAPEQGAILEKELELARLKLTHHVNKLERELE